MRGVERAQRRARLLDVEAQIVRLKRNIRAAGTPDDRRLLKQLKGEAKAIRQRLEQEGKIP